MFLESVDIHWLIMDFSALGALDFEGIFVVGLGRVDRLEIGDSSEFSFDFEVEFDHIGGVRRGWLDGWMIHDDLLSRCGVRVWNDTTPHKPKVTPEEKDEG